MDEHFSCSDCGQIFASVEESEIHDVLTGHGPNFHPGLSRVAREYQSYLPRHRRPRSQTKSVGEEEILLDASEAAGFERISQFLAETFGKGVMVVGAGVLGRLVAEKWLEEDPSFRVVGQTFTSNHHDELFDLGINPIVKGTKVSENFAYVIFCVPPSTISDYSGDVREAVSNWNGEGTFLFTSCSCLYDCSDDGPCDEDSPVVPIGTSHETDLLLNAERVVLDAGGCVVRLAGLYKADRGAHIDWLMKGTVDARADHILNLIHWEDAASLSVAIMKKKLRGRIFLGCDNNPLSRQEMMDLVDKSEKFSEKFGTFTGTGDPLGRRLNNSKTRAELGWEPKYPSFAQFLGVHSGVVKEEDIIEELN